MERSTTNFILALKCNRQYNNVASSWFMACETVR